MESLKDPHRRNISGLAELLEGSSQSQPTCIKHSWEIEVAVHLFHVEQDRFAPYSHAVYLDERVAQSTLHGYSGEGHLFLVRLFGEVFEQVSQPEPASKCAGDHRLSMKRSSGKWT
jgi:hypothetical protein